jgi:branched-chain amino acid transport system permease protein
MSKTLHPGLLATIAVLAVLPFAFPNSYFFDVAIHVGLSAIAAIGLNVLMGFAGQVSIGHAGFLAIGAYLSAILTGRFGWPPLAAMVAAGIVVALLAYLIAKPILRLKGHSLTMATLGFGIIVLIVLTNEGKWTGGPDGVAVEPLSVAGWEFANEKQWYALVAVLLVIAIRLSLNLYDSPAGRALRALHGAEVAAKAAGIDTASFKVRAFVISAVFASIAGSLTAHYTGFITPGLAGLLHSIELATMVVVGGMASTFGALIGAGLLTILPQLLGGLESYEMVAFGLILMLTVIFLPRGLVPTLSLRWRKGGG